jgi:hypothetical protein
MFTVILFVGCLGFMSESIAQESRPASQEKSDQAAKKVDLLKPEIATSRPVSQEKPENLEQDIAEAIRLLEAKDYKGLLKRYVEPELLKNITERLTLEKFAEKFAGDKADKLLNALKATKDLTPQMDHETNIATYTFKQPVDGTSQIRFRKIGKLWYIKN